MTKLWNMRVTVMPIVIGALGTVPKGLEKGTKRVGNRRTNRGHKDYNIVKSSQNTEKSPGDLRKPAVTQTLKKYDQLTNNQKKKTNF